MELRKLVAILQDVAHNGYGDSVVLFRTSEEDCLREKIEVKASHNGAEGVVEVWLA